MPIPLPLLDCIAARILNCSVMELRRSDIAYRDVALMIYKAICDARAMKHERLSAAAKFAGKEFFGDGVATIADWLVGAD